MIIIKTNNKIFSPREKFLIYNWDFIVIVNNNYQRLSTIINDYQ